MDEESMEFYQYSSQVQHCRPTFFFLIIRYVKLLIEKLYIAETDKKQKRAFMKKLDKLEKEERNRETPLSAHISEWDKIYSLDVVIKRLNALNVANKPVEREGKNVVKDIKILGLEKLIVTSQDKHTNKKK